MILGYLGYVEVFEIYLALLETVFRPSRRPSESKYARFSLGLQADAHGY